MAIASVIPNPFSCDTQYRRFHYLDVCDLGFEELVDEVYYLRPLLWRVKGESFRRVLGPYDQERNIQWIRGRIRVLEGELDRRRRNNRNRDQKPKPAEGVTL